MAPRSSWQDGTRPAVAMVSIIVIVTLCAVLSLGRINNERRYDGRSAAAWLVATADTSARTRATAAAALDYLWPVAGPLRAQIVRAEVRLLEDSDADARDEATAALAGMATESPDVVFAVVTVLSRSPRLASRVQAAHVLGAAGPAAGAATPALVRAASASDPSLRIAAVAALGDVGAGRDHSVTTALARAATDGDENVRAVAIEAMVASHAAPVVLIPLAILALRDPAASVREQAAYILAASSDTSQAIRAALTAAATDSDPSVRHLAATALARRHQLPIPAGLVGEADSDGNLHRRRTACARRPVCGIRQSGASRTAPAARASRADVTATTALRSPIANRYLLVLLISVGWGSGVNAPSRRNPSHPHRMHQLLRRWGRSQPTHRV
jgi:hypothetical protein